MKKYLTYALALILMLTMSSWSIKNLFGGGSTATESTAPAVTAPATSPAMTAGQNTGKALSAIYTSYKAAGKIDMKDVNTYAQLGLLVANCAGLKDNYKDKEYLLSYGQGLIAGGMGLVTETNVTDVTGSLTNLANMGSQVNPETINTLTGLMSLLETK